MGETRKSEIGPRRQAGTRSKKDADDEEEEEEEEEDEDQEVRGRGGGGILWHPESTK